MHLYGRLPSDTERKCANDQLDIAQHSPWVEHMPPGGDRLHCVWYPLMKPGKELSRIPRSKIKHKKRHKYNEEFVFKRAFIFPDRARGDIVLPRACNHYLWGCCNKSDQCSLRHLTLQEYKDLLLEWNRYKLPSHGRETMELAKLISNGKRLFKDMVFSIPTSCRICVDPDPEPSEDSLTPRREGSTPCRSWSSSPDASKLSPRSGPSTRRPGGNYFVIADGTKIPTCCQEFRVTGNCKAGRRCRSTKDRPFTQEQYEEEKRRINRSNRTL